MSLQIKGSYKGYVIMYWDSTKYVIKHNDADVQTNLNSLAECVAWIDAQTKTKTKFKRVKVLVEFWQEDGLKEGKATSLVGDSKAWIEGDDSQIIARLNQIWLDTPKNRALLVKVKAKENQLEMIRNEIESLKSKATRLTAGMMIKKE
jgi:hypothetical protein